MKFEIIKMHFIQESKEPHSFGKNSFEWFLLKKHGLVHLQKANIRFPSEFFFQNTQIRQERFDPSPSIRNSLCG
jgi:hypothetical protein